jgi:hypothetical protein
VVGTHRGMSRQMARLAALYRTTQGASVASMPRLFRDAGASSCEGCRSSYPPVGLVHPWCARNEDLDASLRGRRSRWAPVPLHQRERPKVQSVSGGRPPRWLVSTSVSEVSALRETCNRALVPGRWGACPDPRDQDQAHRAGGSWPELTTDANVQPIHGALLSTCGDAGRDDAPDSKGAPRPASRP